jgi:hypothetical protein
MVLTELEIRSTKATEKLIKLCDGDGLLSVHATERRPWWRFKYRFQVFVTESAGRTSIGLSAVQARRTG